MTIVINTIKTLCNNFLQIQNKIPWATLCDAILIASVIFTSKLEFYIHDFGDKKITKKFKVLIFTKIWE